jgi:hypothetical protein
MLVRQNEQHARLAYLLGKWRTDGAARWRQMVSRRRTLPLCDEIASPRFRFADISTRYGRVMLDGD